jgi:hypothetical protein
MQCAAGSCCDLLLLLLLLLLVLLLVGHGLLPAACRHRKQLFVATVQ